MKQNGVGIQVAVASRTDEPDWAGICMKYMVVHDGTTLQSCFDHVEIMYDDKKVHFKNLHYKTGIPYESMAFFDNEYWNITSVATLGVRCFYTPDGMKRKDWDDALKEFD
jgi:magnesium-dependent phosphatase 1